jgi:Dolichyl-phosphate-mannose-protein mannosyltransferase
LSRWWALGWLLPVALQLVHTVAVWPNYHVGSFDDDGNYLMAAHVLASGGGLTSAMPSGASVVANYLPGYPALLVPFIWVWGSSLWVPRVLSAVCVAALYPLLWHWLGRRGVRPAYRVAVLSVLAINPVLATYSSMVMAEAPFLLLLVLTVYAVDAWERGPGWGRAVPVVIGLAALVWVKEAGVGLAAGMVLYLLWRRRWARAVVTAVGTGALLLPGLVARWASGGSALGDRYATEISNSSDGGFLHQLPSEVVHDIQSYLTSALRQSVLPIGSPLPSHGPFSVFLEGVGYTVPFFVIVGAVAWYTRHPRPEMWLIGVYFAETLAYPFTNQRRVVLVLPFVVLWYVVGACASLRWVAARGRRVLSGTVLSAATVIAVLVAGVPTASAFTRDYMFKQGVQSSEFAGSSAMDILRSVGTPEDLVETDYRGSVAYFTDHRTAWTAFVSTTPYGPFADQHEQNCNPVTVSGMLRADQAKFLVVGDVNTPGVMDSPCLLGLASTPASARQMGAVRLLSTQEDQESVFEFVGPGTSQPGLGDWTAARRPPGAVSVTLGPNGQGDAGGTAFLAPSRQGKANFTWPFAGLEQVSQVSVGAVSSTDVVSSVRVQLEGIDGTWRTVATTSGRVGDGGAAPYQLTLLGHAVWASALRVSVTTSGTAQVAYVNAIGSTAKPEPLAPFFR